MLGAAVLKIPRMPTRVMVVGTGRDTRSQAELVACSRAMEAPLVAHVPSVAPYRLVEPVEAVQVALELQRQYTAFISGREMYDEGKHASLCHIVVSVCGMNLKEGRKNLGREKW